MPGGGAKRKPRRKAGFTKVAALTVAGANLVTNMASRSANAAEAWGSAPVAVRNRARWELQTRFPEDRPEQRPPDGEWSVWLFMAGRGAGKTRAAAEDLVHYAYTHPGSRLAVVAPTFADARDTCVEGESGLLACLDREDVVDWNRSIGELVLHNGTRFKLFSGDRPDRLRGPQHHRAWCDELAAFRYPETWDLLVPAMRLGDHPQIVVTTTPKPSSKVLKGLLERAGEDVVVTRASTFDNAANLAQSAVEGLRRLYAGTRYARQELYGEMIDDVEGALWTWTMIDSNRYGLPTEGASRTVVAVDPAATSTEGADETGIVAATCFSRAMPFPKANLVAGEAVDHYFVRADRSGRFSPREWATEAIELYHELKADRIVYERNQGGEMVKATLRNIDPNVPLRGVWASEGKKTRAEPISALYETARVHHVEPFVELESEMTAWVPGEPSPSRMDALVWALTDLVDSSQDFAFAGANGEHPVEAPITSGIMDRRW